MHVTVSAREPEILHDAKSGELFLIHAPVYGECVAALLQTTIRNETPDSRDIVVIGCRVGIAESHYRPTGLHLRLHVDTPITRLDQVESASLRARNAEPDPHFEEALATMHADLLDAVHKLWEEEGTPIGTTGFKGRAERLAQKAERSTPLSDL